MITKRTVTTADGKTIEREYYNDMEVLRDENNRRYYMESNNRIYFNDADDNRGVEPRRDLNNVTPDTRDDRNPNNTTAPNNTNTPKQ